MKKYKSEKKPTSFRFTEEGKELARKIAEKLGIKPAQAWEIAIREKAEREGVK